MGQSDGGDYRDSRRRHLSGGNGDDQIDGGDGDDRIEDTGGSDILRGGAGNDTIFISHGDNAANEAVVIEGGSGNDTVTYQNYRAGTAAIDLGDGDDRLTLWTVQSGGTRVALGAGQDVVAFGSGFDTGLRGALTITDFAAGATGDRFDLTAYLAQALQGWDGNANPFGSAGYLRLLQAGADTLLQIDRNGTTGGANFTTLATLQGTSATALTDANFSGFAPRVVSASDATDAFVIAPSVVNEAVGSFTISVVLKNVGVASGTVTSSLAVDRSTVTNGADVTVTMASSSFNVAQAPVGDYVINLPAIAVANDGIAEGAEQIAIRVRVPGHTFASGTDETVVLISLVDAPPVASDQFIAIANTGVQATVLGTGQVIGASGIQDVTVLDRPGRIQFDPRSTAAGIAFSSPAPPTSGQSDGLVHRPKCRTAIRSW